TCSRTYEPIFRQVSVPGTYQKPAPYMLQTRTYSTGLALTGRSAACAPDPMASAAAEPRKMPPANFMPKSPVSFHLREASSACCPAGCPDRIRTNADTRFSERYLGRRLGQSDWGLRPPVAPTLAKHVAIKRRYARF